MAASVEAKLSREEYLKRYLSGPSNSAEPAKKKKKKKVKEAKARAGIKIVEDDAFISVAPESSSIPSDEDEREDLRREIEISTKLTEIAPKFVKGTFQAIATSEEASTSKQISVRSQGSAEQSPRETADSLGNEDGSLHRISRDVSFGERRCERASGGSKRRRDSSSSDMSVQRGPRSDPSRNLSRKTRRRHDSDDESIKRRESDSDNDAPRMKQSENNSARNIDQKQRSRRKLSHSPKRQRLRDSDDDLSPKRRSNKNSQGSQKGKQRHDSDDDASRMAQRRHDSGSDLSPARQHKEDSDIDVPRIQRRQNSPDDDLSPIRRRRRDSDEDALRKQRRRTDSDSDLSPARRRTRDDRRSSSYSKKRTDWEKSDSNREQGRRREQQINKTSEVDNSNKIHDKREERNIERIERVEDGRLSKTLDGKAAGLQPARAVRDEMKKLQEAENKLFENLGEEVSGRNAAVIRRSKMTGKGRETREEKEKKEREAKKQQELQEKYEKWNKGVQQIKQREERLDEMARVVREGFTRRADNEAMNEHMKGILLADDPMLEHVKKKKLKAEMKTGVVYPTYKGGWPPNRFMIAPGYRWDGVDRSNGFEARIAQTANQKVAEEREYYQNISKYE